MTIDNKSIQYIFMICKILCIIFLLKSNIIYCNDSNVEHFFSNQDIDLVIKECMQEKELKEIYDKINNLLNTTGSINFQKYIFLSTKIVSDNKIFDKEQENNTRLLQEIKDFYVLQASETSEELKKYNSRINKSKNVVNVLHEIYYKTFNYLFKEKYNIDIVLLT